MDNYSDEYLENTSIDETGGNYSDEYLENTSIDETGGNYSDEYLENIDETGGNYSDEYLENIDFDIDETGGNYSDEYLENIDFDIDETGGNYSDEYIDTVIQESGVENIDVSNTDEHTDENLNSMDIYDDDFVIENNDSLDDYLLESIIYDSDNGQYMSYDTSFNPYEINEENTPEPVDDIEDILNHVQNLEQDNDSGYESNDDVDI
jgi:hypothetical protein